MIDGCTRAQQRVCRLLCGGAVVVYSFPFWCCPSEGTPLTLFRPSGHLPLHLIRSTLRPNEADFQRCIEPVSQPTQLLQAVWDETDLQDFSALEVIPNAFRTSGGRTGKSHQPCNLRSFIDNDLKTSSSSDGIAFCVPSGHIETVEFQTGEWEYDTARRFY
jgi:hypothetical protein